MSTTVSANEIAGGLELRKLRSISPSYFTEIVRLLDENEYWKVLMGTVPKELPTEENLNQPVDGTSEKRYNSAQVELVANASKKDGRTGAHIFLFEWSTTGRRRPTLEHLVILMKAANLYGPANYIATKILHQGAVEKPSTGPGKSWSKEFDEMEAALAEKDENVTIENNLDNSKPMNTLCAANAPKLCVSTARRSKGSDGNKTDCDKSTVRIESSSKEPANVPVVEITSATASIQLGNTFKTSDDCKVDKIVLQSPPNSFEVAQNATRPNLSGLMQIESKSTKTQQFSSESIESSNSTISHDSSRSLHSDVTHSTQVLSNVEGNIPDFSDLLNISQKTSQASSEHLENRPQFSALLDFGTLATNKNKTAELAVFSSDNKEISSGNHPNFSDLLGKSTNSSENLPQFSQLLASGENHSSNSPAFSNLIGSSVCSQNLPVFSVLKSAVSPKELSEEDTSSSDDD